MQKINRNIFLFILIIIAIFFLEACWITQCRRWEDRLVPVAKQRCISWDTKGYCILNQYYTENENRPICVEYEKSDDTTKPVKENLQVDSAEKHRAQANKLMKEEKYDLAIKEYTKAIELEPRAPWAYVYRGTAYIKISQYDQATSDFTKVIGIQSGLDHAYRYAYLYRAEINCRLGKYDLAGNDIKKLMSIDKKIGDILIKDSVDCSCLRKQLGNNIKY